MRANVEFTFNQRNGTASVADAVNRNQLHRTLLRGSEEEPGEYGHRQFWGQHDLTRTLPFEMRDRLCYDPGRRGDLDDVGEP
jgi:hypothetical protein